MSIRTLLATLLTPDNPASLVADWFLDKTDRQYIDDQIRTLQLYVSGSLIRGQQSTWGIVDQSSAAVAMGDVLCVGPTTSTDDDPTTASRYVAQAIIAGSMNTAGMVLGIALTAAPKGGLVRYAYDGIVSAAVTGLALVTAGPVRLNTSGLPRCQRVSSALTSGNFPIGYVDNLGNLSLARGLAIT